MKFPIFKILLFFLIPLIAYPQEIKVLLSDNISIYQQTLVGLQSSLNLPIKVYYWNQIQQEYGENIKKFFDTISKEKLIVSIGISTTKILLENLPNTTIVFTHVPEIHNLKINDKICGVDTKVSIENFFKLLKEINSSFRYVLTITSTEIGKNIAYEGIYRDLNHQVYFIHEHITSSNINQSFKEILDNYKNRIDAFFIVEDPVYSLENLNYLSEISKKNQFLVFVKYDSLLKIGGTISISPDFTKVGIKLGEIINKILNLNATCRDIFIETLQEGDLFFRVNEQQAKEQNITLPEKLIQRSNLSKLYLFGVELYQKNKLQSAEKIFKQILEKDPQNPGANYYYALILDKKSGAVTKEALQKAIEFYKNKNYEKSLEQINYGLRVNPIHLELKNLKKQVSIEYSSYLNSQALSREAIDPFESIKLYQKSLQLNNENIEANRNLISLRNRLSVKIPQMIKEAKLNFENRMYKESIIILNNILLIQPGYPIAVEYLRLAQQKQEGLQKILRYQE